MSNSDGTIPLTDSSITRPDYPEDRCTPCLTAAQAEADPDPELDGFDTGVRV